MLKNVSIFQRDPLLLGVVGTDIPTSDLEDLYPKHFLGPFGYPYAINNNGFIVFHPQLHHHMSYLQVLSAIFFPYISPSVVIFLQQSLSFYLSCVRERIHQILT